MRSLHRLAGYLFLVYFLATGFFLQYALPAAAREDLAVRMMFRSTHIYILMAALLNLLLSVNWPQRMGGRRGFLQAAASACLLASPAVLAVAFFLEPQPGRLVRPLTAGGIVLSFLGTILHVLATRPPRAARVTRG